MTTATFAARRSSRRTAVSGLSPSDIGGGNYTWKHKSSGEPAVVKMVHVWTFDGG